MEVKAFYWKGDALELLDQRELPEKEVWLRLKDYREVAQAIRDMAVRGAPAIGCVAAYGFVLGVRSGEDPEKVYETLKNTRPTAYNLFWALDRMKKVFEEGKDIEAEARAIEEEDYQANKRMGEIGQSLIPHGARVLTHCNTGALATAGWGTALGVIRSAHYAGKNIFVWVDETRPYLQGSRLTAWELLRENIPHSIITDSTAGFLMKRGMVDCVIVGADRITKDYYVANKIGTYALSVLAKAHGIPFYVVAPKSTFDRGYTTEDSIVIEERSEREVKFIKGIPVAPENSPALHLAFDITPPENITAIITEEGIIKL
ncbi:S-methyl-5-thioribose-1-phosphate isomerase [Pampinifervens florentissimum]|uniref:S-methyl-5-thioribose-1-phosphate isomerase n=1 Tax=Pampinifervens florentissimum TaxID=1632019 RepID=UPI0013B48280|nr:S-methyl-5-thioribose-1-phosphate isomerase [Hydrogenobacter sp. T-8]QID32781.1 S-methyl-5-thioribose-1-phosphate isomerase [Hydrogenobacter sp. T-8]